MNINMNIKSNNIIMQIMPEFGLAGAEIMCENLCCELKNLGYEVIVVSLFNYHSVITDRLEAKKIKVIYLNKKKGLDLSIIFKLIKLFKKYKPCVIHGHRYVSIYVLPATLFCKIKHKIHTIHSVANKDVNGIHYLFNKLAFKYFKFIPVALSTNIQDSVEKYYKIDKNKIPVINNGINLNKCIKKENYVLDSNITVLHIGRFTEVKNHMCLIKAFELILKKYPTSKLFLIGDGELKIEIQKYIVSKNLNNNIKLLGLISEPYIELNKADIFCLPSKWEGMPMTLIEAMGTGLPICTSDVGGIPNIIQNNYNGILVKPIIEEIRKGLLLLIEDEKLRKKIGTNALCSSNKFSSKIMAKKYLEIYNNEKKYF